MTPRRRPERQCRKPPRPAASPTRPPAGGRRRRRRQPVPGRQRVEGAARGVARPRGGEARAAQAAPGHGLARRVGRQEPQLRRRRLGRLLPDARRDLEQGRVRRLPREARAAGQVVPRPGRGGQEAAHRARPVGHRPEAVRRLDRRHRAPRRAVPRPLRAAPRRGQRAAPGTRRTRPRRAGRAGAGGGSRRRRGGGRPERGWRRRGGPRARGARRGREVQGQAVQVGRLDAADRLRLLRARAVGVREGGHPDPARDRRAVRRLERDVRRPRRPAARRPHLLRQAGQHLPRRDLDGRRQVHPRAEDRRRDPRGEPQGVLLLEQLRRREALRQQRAGRGCRLRGAPASNRRRSPRRRPPSRATPPRSTARAPACSWRSRRWKSAATTRSSS